jgi:hypothetical protein
MAYSSTLKMEAVCSCETSIDFHWTPLRYILEGRDFHNQNLIFYTDSCLHGGLTVEQFIPIRMTQLLVCLPCLLSLHNEKILSVLPKVLV